VVDDEVEAAGDEEEGGGRGDDAVMKRNPGVLVPMKEIGGQRRRC
jgi:hypothetical protein